MQKSIAQQFLEIARVDLNVAWLLHENSKFPMAIFALQQSVEKTMKALGLEGAMVSFDELASGQIGHKAYRIFRAGARQMSKNVQSVLDILETDPSALGFLPISKKVFQQYHLRLKTQEGKIDGMAKRVHRCHGRIHLIPAGVCLCAIAQGQTPAKRSECPKAKRDRDVACPSAAPAIAGRGSTGLAGGAVRVFIGNSGTHRLTLSPTPFEV